MIFSSCLGLLFVFLSDSSVWIKLICCFAFLFVTFCDLWFIRSDRFYHMKCVCCCWKFKFRGLKASIHVKISIFKQISVRLRRWLVCACHFSYHFLGFNSFVSLFSDKVIKYCLVSSYLNKLINLVSIFNHHVRVDIHCCRFLKPFRKVSILVLVSFGFLLWHFSSIFVN